MACKIVYKNNKPVGVEENNDLFQQILSNPQVKDFNEALEIFQQTYSDKFSLSNVFDKQKAIERNNGNPLNLAPNGNPSILWQSYKDLGYTDAQTEELVAQVYSDDFISWFGDWQKASESFFDGDILDKNEALKTFNSSHVVDTNGQPLLMYHGTPSQNITEFNRDKKVRISSGLREVADYFTSNIKLAEFYKKADISEEYKKDIKKQIDSLKEYQLNVRNNREYDTIEEKIKLLRSSLDGKIYSVFLNIKEPYKANGQSLDERAWSNFRLNIGYKTASNKADIMDALTGRNEAAILDKNYDGAIINNIADMMSGKNIFSNNEKDLDEVKEDVKKYTGTVVAVWRPNQIKSAIENIGSFDSTNPDIRYSIIGEKGAKNLDQIEEATFRMDNLTTARLMEKAGKTSLEIKIATGWERGAGKIDSFDRLNEAEAIDELLSKNIIEEVNC